MTRNDRPLTIRRITLFPLEVPLRSPVEHAQASRPVADPIIVKVESLEGLTGYGESIPRGYVTGEDRNSVLNDSQSFLMDEVMKFRATSFAEALEQIDALPWNPPDVPHTEPAGPGASLPRSAARAGFELAMLDAAMRYFHRGVSDVAGWMGLTWTPIVDDRGAIDLGSSPKGARRPLRAEQPAAGRARIASTMPAGTRSSSLRCSGVLASSDLGKTMRRLRMYHWGGFREFKLKVGDDRDDERLRAVAAYLGRRLERGRASLRVDANGAWTPQRAREALAGWSDLPLDGVEQPLPRGEEPALVDLRLSTSLPIIHDESLVTEGDARRLIELGVADVFNIRIAKCGGLLPALRLANLASRHGVGVQLGCMVGETSILAGAALRLLEAIPRPLWFEGCFGARLLARDVVRRSLRFGYAGRLPAFNGFGWGGGVDDARLTSLCAMPPIMIELG